MQVDALGKFGWKGGFKGGYKGKKGKDFKGKKGKRKGKSFEGKGKDNFQKRDGYCNVKDCGKHGHEAYDCFMNPKSKNYKDNNKMQVDAVSEQTSVAGSRGQVASMVTRSAECVAQTSIGTARRRSTATFPIRIARRCWRLTTATITSAQRPAGSTPWRILWASLRTVARATSLQLRQ